MHVDIGIRVENVVSFELALPYLKHNQAQTAIFYRDLLDRLNHAPGIDSPAATTTLPMTGGMQGGAFRLDDRPKPPNWRDELVILSILEPVTYVLSICG